MVLRGADGQPPAQIAWPREHAGLRALQAHTLPSAAGFLILALLTGAAVWQIVRVARRLLAYERAWGRAMRDLEDARDRAETANVAKSQFLANMSHEIRTPLTGVPGMAQALARSDLKPEDRDKLQLIRLSGENLLSLLNDLLDLGKVEAGCMEIDFHDFNLGESSTFAFELPPTWVGEAPPPRPGRQRPRRRPAVHHRAGRGGQRGQPPDPRGPAGAPGRVPARGRRWRRGGAGLRRRALRPGADGRADAGDERVEATLAIRRREAGHGLPPTPILALSANVVPHQVAHYLAAGMDGLIPKPIEVRTMLEVLADRPPARVRGAA